MRRKLIHERGRQNIHRRHNGHNANDGHRAQQQRHSRVLAPWRHRRPQGHHHFVRAPAVRLFAAKIQKQLRLAEAVGGVHLLLPVLLQKLSGRVCVGQPAAVGLLGGAAILPGHHPKGVCLQAVVQESRLFLPGGQRAHVQSVDGSVAKHHTDARLQEYARHRFPIVMNASMLGTAPIGRISMCER